MKTKILMTELYGWKLTIVDYEHNDDDEKIEKYYIQRRNAVKAGVTFLSELLRDIGWDSDMIADAQQEYQKLVNTIDLVANVTTPIDSFFNHNSIDIELVLIPYEDEIK